MMRSSVKQTVDPDDGVVSINWQLISQLLSKQTIRWCQVTATLWSIIALDTQRNLDQNSISQFVEVIYWRAHGKITEEEFSVLFSEWMKPQQVANTNSNNSTAAVNNNKKKVNNLINVMLLRHLIFEKKYVEADLDLFIGIIVHETNIRLLNSTISYTNKSSLQSPPPTATMTTPKVTFSTFPAYSLEVVTSKWLELSEELFFLFDTPGYGSLKYDEIYFFMTGVLIGLQNWKTDLELENTLQLIHTSSMTLQVMKEFGVNIQTLLTPGRVSLPLITSSPTRSHNTVPVRKQPLGQQHSLQKFEVSLIMFKKFLLKKHLGENELQYLIQFFQDAIERINKLAKLSNAEELFLACSPVENLGQIIGSPRLWQHAVLLAAGYKTSIPSQLPPIMSFLLSDGDLHVSALFRAIEFPIEGIGFGQDGFSVSAGSNPLQNAAHSLVDYNNPLLSTIAANEELHDNVLRLFVQFRKWGQHPTSSMHGFPSNSHDGTTDHQRDPIYQLILSVLLQYKRLQHFLSAAFFDFAVSQFGLSPQSLTPNIQQPASTATNQYNHSLAILCHGLVPNNQEVLSEFGLIDNLLIGGGDTDNLSTTSYQSHAKSVGNNTVLSGSTSASNATNNNRYNKKVDSTTTATTVSATAKRMLLDELNQELQYDEETEDDVGSGKNELFEQSKAAARSKAAVKGNDNNGRRGVNSTNNSISSTVTSKTQDTNSISAPMKISNIPIAEKRKTDLLQLNQQKPSSDTSSQCNDKESLDKGSTAIKEPNQKRSINAVPNYIKPTATSSAKSYFVGGKYITTEIEPIQHQKYAPPIPAASNINKPGNGIQDIRKTSPGVIPMDSTTISPVIPMLDSAAYHRADVQFGSDSEYSQLDQIQWKSLLDTPFTTSSNAMSSSTNLSQNTASINTNKQRNDKNNSVTMSSPSATNEKDSASPVKLTNEESRLFAQLLISSDPHEQKQLIEALRKKLNNFSLGSSSKDWEAGSGEDKAVSTSSFLRKPQDELNNDSSILAPQHDLFDLSLPPPPARSITPNSIASSQQNIVEANPSEASSSTNISAPSSVSDLFLYHKDFY